MPIPSALWPWLALTPFVAAVAAPWLVHAQGRRAPWLLALVPAALFGMFVLLAPAVAQGEVVLAGIDWVPSLGVRYAVRIDGLSLGFALLVTGIGTAIVVYAGGYLAGHPHLPRFMALFLGFMGAMLGLVLADDLVAMFVFYELTAILSFLLIGFDHAREAARRAALQALIVTGGGGLALLAGLLAMRLAGAGSVTELVAAPDLIRDGGSYGLIFALVCLGAFTKSAQVPFHSWLPNAMEAPTPVSAYLHSATMVQAGVFVLMRFAPVLGGTEAWATVLPLVGGTTLLAGTLLAMRQTDMKQVLAFTTVASLGLLVLLLGVGTEGAIVGAALYLLAHALFKAGLFMVAGAVDHATGTRDLRRLGGLAVVMPLTFAAALLGTLSMAGLPPLLGFVAKEVLYGGLSGVAVAVALIGNALMVALAGVLVLPFLRRIGDMPRTAHEVPPSLWLGALVVGSVGLAAAALLDVTSAVVAPLASALAGHPVVPSLHLWPTELSDAVVLSLATFAAGFGLFGLRQKIGAAVERGLDAVGWGPDRGFDQAMHGLVRGSHALAVVLQPGLMQRYVTTAFVVLGLVLLVPLAVDGLPPFAATAGFAEPYVFVVAGVAVAGLAIVITARHRLVAIVSLGVQGVMVALLFMLYGAPDLSFTQFMIETLSVVILALVMTRLDVEAKDHRRRWDAAKDGFIAGLCGIGVAVLLIGIVQVPFDRRLSDFFMTYAEAIAHGHNVVNVIIVDFRGLDTLGEIAVVMAAGLAILALLRMGPRKGEGA